MSSPHSLYSKSMLGQQSPQPSKVALLIHIYIIEIKFRYSNICVRFLCLERPLNFYYLSLESLFFFSTPKSKICKTERQNMLFLKFRVKSTVKLVVLCSRLYN